MVIIKGMEMPKVCDDCRFYNRSHNYPLCMVTGDQRGYRFDGLSSRMESCPLCSVTDGNDGKTFDNLIVDEFFTPAEDVERWWRKR